LVPATKLLSAAAQKNVQIFSKFLGDEVEVGDHDKRQEVEEDIVEAIVSYFEATQSKPI